MNRDRERERATGAKIVSFVIFTSDFGSFKRLQQLIVNVDRVRSHTHTNSLITFQFYITKSIAINFLEIQVNKLLNSEPE